MLKRIQNLFIGVAFFIGVFFAIPSFAAETNFSGGSVPAPGGIWRLHLILESPVEKINAIGGEIIFPADILKIVGTETAKSILNLWVEEPKARTEGVVNFAGITPGGFQGEKGEILTIVFEVLKKGSGEIRFDKAEMYLNDGKGTKADLKIKNYIFEEGTGVGESFVKDTVPPPPFTVSFGRDSLIYDNKWFVVFSTQDKETGIDRYEVQEAKGEPDPAKWKAASSPYLLSDQSLTSKVYVRAIDKGGNITLGSVVYEKGTVSYRNTAIWSIILVFIASIFIVWAYIGRKSRKK